MITSACFTGANLGVLAGGVVLGFVLWSLPWVPTLVWLVTGAAYVSRVISTAANPLFIEAVAREDALLPPAPSRKVLEQLGSGGGGLSGKYLSGYDRVKELKEGLAREIMALPPGPGLDAFAEFVPRLDEVTTEVHRLVTRMAQVDRELAGGAVEVLEREVGELAAKVAGATDAEARASMEAALAKKNQALDHYRRARSGVARIEAQVEAIASGLQEARARISALAANPGGGIELTPAQRAVEGISRDVKYLAETVEETTKLLD
jgi:hypothetical protein